MATEIEFCLLGPLTVRCGGVVVPVPAGKPRTVLAALDHPDAGRVRAKLAVRTPSPGASVMAWEERAARPR